MSGVEGVEGRERGDDGRTNGQRHMDLHGQKGTAAAAATDSAATIAIAIAIAIATATATAAALASATIAAIAANTDYDSRTYS